MSATIQYGNTNTFDVIENLPTDDNKPSHNEIQIVETLFQKEKGPMELLTYEIQYIFVLALLFIMFSFPFVDNIIQKIVPSSKNSVYFLLTIKAISFSVLYYLIKNFYLTRK